MLSVFKQGSDTNNPSQFLQHEALFEERERELSVYFAEALAGNSTMIWQRLLDHLFALTLSELSQLFQRPLLQHYIPRALDYARKNSDELAHLDISGKFAALFPESRRKFMKKDSPTSPTHKTPHRNSLSPTISKLHDKRHKHSITVGSEIQHLFDVNTHNLPITYRAPTLKVSDLGVAAGDIFQEISVPRWKSAANHTTDMPVSLPPTSNLEPVIQTPPLSSSCNLPISTAKSQDPNTLSHNVVQDLLAPTMHLHTIHDVIEAFATGKMKCSSDIVYLNYTNVKPWNPYNLIIVPKMMINAEHFIASKFGLLHLFADGSYDLQSFADWSREATLFCLFRQIPFFHQCLMKKSIWHWHMNAKRCRFIRLRKDLGDSCVKCCPMFSNGLLKIQHLCEELLTVSFYGLVPLGGYSMTAYKNELRMSISRAQDLLRRYFKYCRRVATEAAISMQGHLRELEEKVSNQPFVSELPISVQKEKQSSLKKELHMAQHWVAKTGSYILLIEHMVLSSLMHLAQQNVKHWLKLLMPSPLDSKELPQSDNENKALLRIHLIIEKVSGTVTLNPALDEVVSALTEPLVQIPEVISNAVQLLFFDTSQSNPTDYIAKAKPQGPVDGEICEPVRCETNTNVLESQQAKSCLANLKLRKRVLEIALVRPFPTLMVPDNVKQKLQNDNTINIKAMQACIDLVKEELQTVCVKYRWLADVHTFIQTTHTSSNHSLSSHDFESFLNQLHSWKRALESIPPVVPMSHRIVSVQLNIVTSSLLSQLSVMLAEVEEQALISSRRFCSTVLDQTKHYCQSLCTKNCDLEGLAQFAKLLRGVKTFQQHEASRVDCILDLHQTLMKYDVQVPDQDRLSVQELKLVWEEFEMKVKEASEFMDAQALLKANELQENILLCEKEMKTLIDCVNKKPFTDPSSAPTEMIRQMKKIQDDLLGIRTRIMGFSKWKEAITGAPLDITKISSLVDGFFVRYELWKSRKAYDSIEREWMKTPFKKLDISIVANSLSEWLNKCSKLQPSLPARDPVLESWRARLLEFQDEMHLLQQLSSKSLKKTHWQTIFSVLGQDYVQSQQYLLTDIISYNVFEHSDIIMEICHDALQEEKLKTQVIELEEKWDKMSIILAQISSDKYQFVVGLSDRQQKAGRKAGDKMATFALGVASHLEPSSQCLLTIENNTEISLMLEDNITQLKVLFDLPHNSGTMLHRIESLLLTLRQLDELFTALTEDLKKWLELLFLFSGLEEATRIDYGLDAIRDVTERLQEVMQSIREDPRVLSLLTKKRGQTGVRELQGDSLRTTLDAIDNALDSLFNGIQGKLTEQSTEFSRLFFLPAREALTVLSHTGNPTYLVPLIGKMFPSITNICVAEAASLVTQGNETMEGFQVVSIQGTCGQRLELVVPLSIGRKPAAQWLKALETAMKHSIACQFTECQSAMPEGLVSLEVEPDSNSLQQWMNIQLMQSVAMVSSAIWDQAVHNAFMSHDSHVQTTSLLVKLKAVSSFVSEQLKLSHYETSLPRSYIRGLQSLLSILNFKITLIQAALMDPMLSSKSFIVNAHFRYSLSTTQQCSTPPPLRESHTHLEQPTHIRLQNRSSHSLLSSSRSLLSSRYHLSKSDLQKTGASTPALEALPKGLTPAKCLVHFMDTAVPYAYELGLHDWESPFTFTTEPCLISLATTLCKHEMGVVLGESPHMKGGETALQVARILGRHCYQLQCTPKTTQDTISRVLFGSLQTGSLLVLKSCDNLGVPVLVSIGHLLQKLYHSVSQVITCRALSISGACSSQTIQSMHSLSSNKASSHPDWYKISADKSLENRLLDFEMMGTRVKMNTTFGCVATLDKCAADMPHCITSLWKPVEVVVPSTQLIIESLLLSAGFFEVKILSTKLAAVLECIQTSLNSTQSSFHHLRIIVAMAMENLRHTIAASEPNCRAMSEQRALSTGITQFFQSRLNDSDMDKVGRIVRCAFDAKEGQLLMVDYREELEDAIKIQLRERHLQLLPDLINKMMDLHVAFQHSKCIVLCGPSGTGKTTSYQLLCAAYYHLMSSKSKNQYPLVNTTVMNTAAYSLEQLLGSFSSSGHWRNGILANILSQIHFNSQHRIRLSHVDLLRTIGSVNHWLVLDGPIDEPCANVISSLIVKHGCYYLSNGSTLSLPDSCQVVIETDNIQNLSPSLLASSAILHYKEGNIVTWEALVNTWLEKAPTCHNLTAMSVEILSSMIKGILMETLQFISSDLPMSAAYLTTTTAKMAQTGSLLNLLSALLRRSTPSSDTSCLNSTTTSSKSSSEASSGPVSEYISNTSLREPSSTYGGSTSTLKTDMVQQDAEKDYMSEVSNTDIQLELTSEVQMASLFAMAYIWSIGAYVPFNKLSAFNEFARSQLSQLLYNVPLPVEGSVFDYYLDLKSYQFIPWAQRQVTKYSSNFYVALPEMECYAYLTELYISSGLNVIIIGDPGCGKSSLVENLIQTHFPLTKIPITSGLLSSELQKIVTTKIAQLEKRAGQKSKHLMDHRCIFFIDDLHMALGRNQNQTQSVLQTLWCMLSSSTITDPFRHYQHSLHNVRFLATCRTAEVPYINPRILAKFNPIPLLPISDETLYKIFLKSVKGWVDGFHLDDIAETFSEAMAAASVTVFRSIFCKYSPTLSHPYLSYTLHDLMQVCRGLHLLSPQDQLHSTLPQFKIQSRRGHHSLHDAKEKKPKHQAKSGAKAMLTSQDAKQGISRLRNQSQLNSKPKLPVELNESNSQARVHTLRSLIRLWCHENTRVYLDRMPVTDGKDRSWLLTLLEACARYCFCGNGPQSSVPNQDIGTAVQNEKALRRTRGGRARTNLPQQPTGPSEDDLINMGIKMETFRKLLPCEMEIPEKRHLISMEQVAMKGEDLTGLIFAHFPGKQNQNSTHLENHNDYDNDNGGSAKKEVEPISGAHSTTGIPYGEMGDGQIIEEINNYMAQTNSEEPQLVLFKLALEHIVRLTRVLALKGSHSILLGPPGVGRKSLIRLTSALMNAKLYPCSQDASESEVKKCLKEVCMSAGLDQVETVLMVTNSGKWSNPFWHKITQIMNEGLCPDLFSSSELLMMSSKVNKLKKTAEHSYQEFGKLILKHLHVLVVWNSDHQSGSPFCRGQYYKSSSCTIEELLYLEGCQRAVFSTLCQSCSHIDYYHQWSGQAYADIALYVWQKSITPKWEDWNNSSSQLEAVSKLAAHVHLTTQQCLNNVMPTLSYDLISPISFMECIRMTQTLAVKMKDKHKQSAERFQKALNKFGDIEGDLHALQNELKLLRPQHKAAEDEAQQKMSSITAAKEYYMAASRRCKDAEETIQNEMRNVNLFQEVLKRKLEEVSPLYESSLKTLSSLSVGDILEVASYRVPPLVLEPVFHALCVLFDRPQTWEDCKQLMLSEKFYENLKFFDKDKMPSHKLHTLKKVIDKTSKFSGLEEVSKGIVPLCKWLVALVHYQTAKMALDPLQQKLNQAENKRLEALQTYVSMRKEMEQTKKNMEETVSLHKESVQRATAIEDKISDLEKKVSKADSLLQAFSSERVLWEEKSADIQIQLENSSGHALLSAANVCYLACLPVESCKDLMKNWLLYCQGIIPFGSLSTPSDSEEQRSAMSHQAVVQLHKSFSASEAFSSQEERLLWGREQLFYNLAIQERVLAARACSALAVSQWPLVFDPHIQFCYLATMMESRHNLHPQVICLKKSEPLVTDASTIGDCTIFRLSDSDLTSKLALQVAQKAVVALVLDTVNRAIDPFLKTLLQRTGVQPNYTIHPEFRLYLIIERDINDVGTSQLLCNISQTWHDFCIINLDMGMTGLCDYFQRFVIDCIKPGFSNKLRSAKADWAHYYQQLEIQQSNILAAFDDASTSLSDSGLLLIAANATEILVECKAAEAAALNQIAEGTKALKALQKDTELYRPLAEHATISFKVIRRLSKRLQYFSFSIKQFEVLLSEVVGSEKILDHQSTISGHVLHFVRRLSSSVYSVIQRSLYKEHQALFPLLLSFEVLLSCGKMSAEEVQLFDYDPLMTEDMMSHQLDQEAQTSDEKPSWIQLETWVGVLRLQKHIHCLKSLGESLYHNQEEWQEYFESEPSFLAQLPGIPDALPAQKLLVWKTLKPEMFLSAVHHFITLVLGEEFTATLCPNIISNDHIPNVCICLVHEKDVGKAFQQLSPHITPIHQFSAAHDKDIENLEVKLPELISLGGYILVEHLHHCYEWTSKLKGLLLKIQSLNAVDNLKIFIILPVTAAKDLKMKGVDFPTAVMEFDTNRPSGISSALQSIQVKDFWNKLLSWEDYEPLVSRLMQLIPHPHMLIRHNVHRELSTRKSESNPLLYCVAEELLIHNRFLANLHLILLNLQDILRTKTTFTYNAVYQLIDILHNKVPSVWFSDAQLDLTWSLNKDELALIPFLELLKCRMLFYTNINLPCTTALNALLFSNTSLLVSQLHQSFAEEQHIPLENVFVQAQISQVESKKQDNYVLVFSDLNLYVKRRTKGMKCIEDEKSGQKICLSVEMLTEPSKNALKYPIFYPEVLGCGDSQLPLKINMIVKELPQYELYFTCNMPHC